MYPVSVTLIKLALLFQYLRVFEVGSRTRVFCKFMIAVTTAWGAAFIMLRWIPCFPVAAYWDYSIQGARCWGYNSRDPRSFMRVFVGQATSTAVLDLIVFAIPIQLGFRTDTQRNTKLCLLGLLVLGSMYVTSEHFFPLNSPPHRAMILPDTYLVVTQPLWQVYLVRNRSYGLCHSEVHSRRFPDRPKLVWCYDGRFGLSRGPSCGRLRCASRVLAHLEDDLGLDLCNNRSQRHP